MSVLPKRIFSKMEVSEKNNTITHIQVNFMLVNIHL